jgi:hypothetical protein
MIKDFGGEDRVLSDGFAVDEVDDFVGEDALAGTGLGIGLMQGRSVLHRILTCETHCMLCNDPF